MRKELNIGRVLMVVLGLSVLWSGPAAAVHAPDYEVPYIAGQYAYEYSDYVRDSDNGRGYQITAGMPLAWFGLDNWQRSAFEFNYYDVRRERHLDDRYDYQTALMLDWVGDLGLYGWDTRWLPRFKPFGLLGLGGINEDVQGDEHWHFGAEAGAGLLFPIPFYGLALRTEGRVQYQHNNSESVRRNDNLVDYRVTAGLQLPLWFLAHKDMVGPGAECALAVVDPVTGRQDCANDSDHDGVADSIDQCPGTPAGVMVDRHGCPSEGGMLRGVEFDTASANLTADSKIILDNVATALLAPGSENVTVEIAGHTDSRGGVPFNLMLSEQRAESVKQYLLAKGIAAERMRTRGYGEAEPVAPNNNPEGQHENRRVEFRIVVD